MAPHGRQSALSNYSSPNYSSPGSKATGGRPGREASDGGANSSKATTRAGSRAERHVRLAPTPSPVPSSYKPRLPPVDASHLTPDELRFLADMGVVDFDRVRAAHAAHTAFMVMRMWLAICWEHAMALFRGMVRGPPAAAGPPRGAASRARSARGVPPRRGARPG